MVKRKYPLPYALVRFVDITGVPDEDTYLFPTLDTRLEQMSSKERKDFISKLSSMLVDYKYTNYKDEEVSMSLSIKDKDKLDVRNVIIDIFEYLGHSKARAGLVVFETHNTEYLDNFDTDPFTSRWSIEVGTAVYDGTEFEMDVENNAEHFIRYQANSPGSIEHEAQATSMLNPAVSNRVGLISCRMRNSTSPDDAYTFWFDGGNTINLTRYNAGVRTGLAAHSGGTQTVGDFYTGRIATSGAVGEQVVIAYWWQDHDTPKPSDPGWIGVDESPNASYTDTSASGGGAGQRLDTATHTQCGVAGRGRNTDANVDTHHDFFKIRAISDRGGVPALALPAVEVRGGVKVKGGVNFR